MCEGEWEWVETPMFEDREKTPMIDMFKEFLAAISIKLQFEHFKTASSVYSLTPSRHALFLFLISDSISKSKERI